MEIRVSFWYVGVLGRRKSTGLYVQVGQYLIKTTRIGKCTQSVQTVSGHSDITSVAGGGGCCSHALYNQTTTSERSVSCTILEFENVPAEFEASWACMQMSKFVLYTLSVRHAQ